MQNVGHLVLKVIHQEDGPSTRTEGRCPLCQGMKFKLSADGFSVLTTANGTPIPCECQRPQLAAAAMSRYGLDVGEYEHMRLDAYKPLDPTQFEALRYCREVVARWTAGERTGAILFSETPGLGKTHLAVGMLVEAALTGMSIGFYSMPRFFDDLLDSFGQHTTGDLTQQLIAPDVVLLDDLGAEMRTGEMVQRTYFHILDERMMNNRIVLVTTNLSESGMTRVLGARCYSRLRALCPDNPRLLNGKDYRLNRRTK